MVLRKDHDQSDRCRELHAQRVGISLDKSPARIAPAVLLCHLPSRLDFAAGFLRVRLNQPRYRWANCKHAPAPIVVSVRLLENARHHTLTVITLKSS